MSSTAARGRGVEPEVGDVLGGDGQVLGADPGDLAGGAQPGDAQVRLRAAGEDEVQRGREAEDQRLEEQHERVVVGDVDVVEDDERVAGDGRRGDGAHVRRQGGDLVAAIRRLGGRVRRQIVGEAPGAVCSAIPSTRAWARAKGVQPDAGRRTSMLGAVAVRPRSIADFPHPAPATTSVRR